MGFWDDMIGKTDQKINNYINDLHKKYKYVLIGTLNECEILARLRAMNEYGNDYVLEYEYVDILSPFSYSPFRIHDYRFFYNIKPKNKKD